MIKFNYKALMVNSLRNKSYLNHKQTVLTMATYIFNIDILYSYFVPSSIDMNPPYPGNDQHF